MSDRVVICVQGPQLKRLEALREELTTAPTRLLPVKCPECGKVYTRALPGSGVEVQCRACKTTTVVLVLAS